MSKRVMVIDNCGMCPDYDCEKREMYGEIPEGCKLVSHEKLMEVLRMALPVRSVKVNNTITGIPSGRAQIFTDGESKGRI